LKGIEGAERLDLVETAEGTRLRLKVRAGAERDALQGEHAGVLKLGVTAAPERGKANHAVLRLLAERLGLAPSTLSLVSGHASPEKIVLVPLGRAETVRRLRGDEPA